MSSVLGSVTLKINNKQRDFTQGNLPLEINPLFFYPEKSFLKMRGCVSLFRWRGVDSRLSKARAFGSTGASRIDADDMHQFSGGGALDWHGWRKQTALRIGREEHKRWPLHEKVLAAGPAYVNVAQKVQSALRTIDRVLDVFEPGQLALAFNGSKDDTVLMHLFIEACKHHPSHSFAHIQPVWFRNAEHEHPEVKEYIMATADQHFTHRNDLLSQSPSENSTNRLWTMHVGQGNSKQFIDAVIYLSQQTAIRCLILGNRRTDTGCRDLAPMALMDLAPIMLSGSMSRMKLETKLNMLQFEDPGLPGTRWSKVREPSLLRFSPTLEWSYRDIWDFIRCTGVPYCALYDKGYSAIGPSNTSVPNPRLRIKDVLPGSNVAKRFERLSSAETLRSLHGRLARVLGMERVAELERRRGEDLRRHGVTAYDAEYVALQNKGDGRMPRPFEASSNDVDPSAFAANLDASVMSVRGSSMAELLSASAFGGAHSLDETLFRTRYSALFPLDSGGGGGGLIGGLIGGGSVKSIHQSHVQRRDPEYLPAWMLSDESAEGESISKDTVQDVPSGVPSSTMGNFGISRSTAAVLVVGDEYMTGEVREGNSQTRVAHVLLLMCC